MPEIGERQVFTADGHDEVSSLLQQTLGIDRWVTPSGQPLREGRRYEKEWRMKFRTVRISSRQGKPTITTLKYRGGWHVVSEALPE